MLPKIACKDCLNSATGLVLEIGFGPQTVESEHSTKNRDLCKLFLVPQPWLPWLAIFRTRATGHCQKYQHFVNITLRFLLIESSFEFAIQFMNPRFDLPPPFEQC